MSEWISGERVQYCVLIILSLGVAGLVGILYRRDKLAFRSFIGHMNPLIAIVLIILVGIILLSVLLSRGWFAIYGEETLRGLAVSSALAALLALVMILVDRRAPLPADINVAFPNSLLFYPAVAYVVEVLFHVLPLSLLLILITSLSKDLRYETVVWPCLLIVSILEPVYHTVLNISRQYPVSTTAYIALHVFVINLLQLLAFKRYDFVSMYGLRFAYYMLWHILWGHVRLRLLF